MSHSVEHLDYSAMRVAVANGVATVTIDHPPLNVLGVELVQDLRRFVEEVESDERIRVVVLESADPEFFIAHGDSNYVTEPDLMARASEGLHSDELNFMQVLHERLRALPQVTIAKLVGFARGGGLEIAMALDMRFAAIGRTFVSMPEARIDIAPGGGGSQYLPRLAGRARALEVILGGGLVDAELAERYGIVNRALPPDALDDFVASLARTIADLAPGVIDAVVTSVDAAVDLSIRDGLALENRQLTSLFTPEAARRSVELLARGLQTRAGEKRLEELLSEPR